MQRTYWIRYFSWANGCYLFDKIVYRDADTRPRWHKVGALDSWKAEHKGYAYLRIDSVFTKAEMKEYGYSEFI